MKTTYQQNKPMSTNALRAICIFLILCGCSLSAFSTVVDLYSQDKNYHFQLDTGKDGHIHYTLSWKQKPVILPSNLGFQLSDMSDISSNLMITHIEMMSTDQNWEPICGEKNSYKENYNEATITFSTQNKSVKNFKLKVRAYNEGLAFCYEFNEPDNIDLASELTSFTFTGDPKVWVSEKAQANILAMKLSEVKMTCERPLLAEVADSVYIALGEAASVDFAAMRFEKPKEVANTLKVHLVTEYFNKTYPIYIPQGNYSTPWRYIMAGKSPAEILQNNFLILNLNEENKFADTSYIKPGKVIRETTLSTEGSKACIDFAVKHNLQYIELDGGWYGNPWLDESDARTVSPDPNRSAGPLDLKEIINYGKEHGIGVILYVDRRELERKLDELLPLYKSWGVVGIKFGFVQVGPQKWTKWLHDAIIKAAEYDLMVDIHDSYRPTGFSRTYPNLLTQEGIRGDEESPTNDMVIRTLFTRMIAGAGDHTYCYFANRVQEMGSHASQLAKAICIYSPWQFIYWYDRPEASPSKIKDSPGDESRVIHETPELILYDKLPTVWDDTRIVDGYPGEFAVVARKKEDAWFLGAMTGSTEKDLNLKLDFLDQDKKYQATIFSDDSSMNTKTKVKMEKKIVSKDFVLQEHILKQNGLAIMLEPLNK